MPQVIALAIAGAGLLAGYKWLSREFQRAMAEVEAGEEMQRQQAQAAVLPKDLGALEWDADAGVYRPRRE